MSDSLTDAVTWRSLYDDASRRLPSRAEARWIIERAGAEYPLGLDSPVPAWAMSFVEDMVSRRVAGEPLQYVLGEWSFRTLELRVDRRVLIPRPETEQVVEIALEEAARLPDPIVAAD